MNDFYFDSFDCQIQSDEFATSYEEWLEMYYSFEQWCEMMEEEYGHEENPKI